MLVRVLGSLMLVLCCAGNAFAARLTVTSAADGAVGAVSGCSLREAVNAINEQANGAGCVNGSSDPYGTNDEIRFAETLSVITLTRADAALPTTSLFLRRPVVIRGRGPLATTIDGGGASRTTLFNHSRVVLRSIRLRNAATGLFNAPGASASLSTTTFAGHSRRAIVNQGHMVVSDSLIAGNPGGGIANANPIDVSRIGLDSLPEVLQNCPPNEDCNLGPGGSPPTQPVAFDLAAFMEITDSTVRDNGPVECAGIANGGGFVSGQGGSPVPAPSLSRQKLEGSLVVRTTRVTRNDAGSGNGGGLCNQGTALISESEISANRAMRGGGIAAVGVSLTEALARRPVTVIQNSTITLNTAARAGGGLFAGTTGGKVQLRYVTVALNRAEGTGAADAGGIAGEIPRPVTAHFTAFVGNRSGNAGTAVQTCAQVSLDGDFNFWAVADPGTCSLSGQHNVRSGDARLGALRPNGSRVRSHLPRTGSVLLNAIPRANPGCSGTDQRGNARPRDAGDTGCDVGAVER